MLKSAPPTHRPTRKNNSTAHDNKMFSTTLKCIAPMQVVCHARRSIAGRHMLTEERITPKNSVRAVSSFNVEKRQLQYVRQSNSSRVRSRLVQCIYRLPQGHKAHSHKTLTGRFPIVSIVLCLISCMQYETIFQFGGGRGGSVTSTIFG